MTRFRLALDRKFENFMDARLSSSKTCKRTCRSPKINPTFLKTART